MPVPREQFRLLPAQNPLKGWLGEIFWEEIPKGPGVYLFWSGEGEVLYAGKSCNLRNRLFSYKNAKPSSVSRKIIRLIRETARISWHLTAGETEALLEENRLIRLHRPPYNSANKSPETYYFLLLSRPTDFSLRLELRMSVPDGFAGQVFGAFKGHGPVRRALGALNRLLFRYSILGEDPLPRELTRVLTPRIYTHTFDVPVCLLHRLTRQFLSGESPALLRLLEPIAETAPDRFTLAHLAQDEENLRHFYRSYAAYHACLQRHFNLRTPLIPQEDADDFRVMLFGR
ncbi:GIY-YIG nuclease family protein [Cyclonatronum proteinivorum]|uniref:GIY-YIG nuclease family protein n=1 Tax=Cyclonatronum proteinivorum TaxID=1457365 RepID=UPI0013DEC37D|nr:GIY-YIG nuclease family protein [Cyclonatronum proteinivorum]